MMLFYIFIHIRISKKDFVFDISGYIVEARILDILYFVQRGKQERLLQGTHHQKQRSTRRRNRCI